MCGICGELNFQGKPPNLSVLDRMKGQLASRGPNQAGTYSNGPLAFGHRRLSVIDPSYPSYQPMTDHNLGLTIVFNGTIYNYHALHNELSNLDYSFLSQGDTEVIIKAYDAWGENCPEHLHGMFAFALWDERKKSMFLCRDRMGIKPLYFSLFPDKIRFASNTQALLAAGGIDTSIDPIALHHHLTLHAVVPAPRTLLQGVRKLEPGTSMTIDQHGQHQSRRYWQLTAQRPKENISEAEWIERTRVALNTAVQNHFTVADVPVGILLSGGLDSSLLVGLLAEAGVKKIPTFSIGFEDAPAEKGNEFEYSDLIVQHFQTDHHRYTIANDEVLQYLPAAVQAMSEPMVGQDTVAFFLLSERVSQTVPVVQSGQGADEVFAGYFWYPFMAAEQGDLVDRFRKYYFDRSHAEFLETVHPDYHGKDHTADCLGKLLSQPGADTDMDQILRMDVTTLIVDDPVKRVDNMTMAWGLEARVPFLDHNLVETAFQMPPEVKLKENGKYPLKMVARNILPAAIIDRPKGYFPMPALKYIQGDFLDFMRDTLMSRQCRQRGLFQPSYVKKMLAAPDQYMTPLQGSKLWHLALLETWLQTHIG
ncbi:N-acetylglutaminylglutamine amidotransferase [Candidatus Electrothrix sp.]|uniref:N-acetylglutaminylglutamine amidotransferase n=1 Tax=Candidatus Electrothrix sp. TaxID=2170559 RepID=UPI0040575E67